MPAIGYVQVHAYSSFAQLPLADVAVTVTTNDSTAIAMRLTDRSGRIVPVEVPVPDGADSRQPGEEHPFTAVTIHARLSGYAQVRARNVQVFADTVTVQDLELLPLAELPGSWDQSEDYDTPPQNL